MTQPGADRRPRVLHVAHQVLPHVGGLETVVEAETVRLVERGWDVTVVSSTGSTSSTGGTGGAGTDAPAAVPGASGVRTVRTPAWNGLERRFGIPFPIFSPRLAAVLVREVRATDVVHVHDVLYLSSWVAAAACRALRTPYLVHRHVGFVHHSSPVVRVVQELVLRTVGRWVLRGAAGVLAIDEHVAQDVRRAGATDVVVLPNGVDTDRFRPGGHAGRRRVRRELGLPLERPLVLFVGRPVPKKGFDDVAAAVSDRYHLVVAGGDRPAGYDDQRLHFLGEVAPGRMPEVYACADAAVVASHGECPLTVLEALSSGLPVVLREDPALHSPWTAGPGVRFVRMRPGELRAALEELLDRPAAARADGRRGREHVEGSFDWERHVDRLAERYRSLVGAEPSRPAGRSMRAPA